MELEKLPYPRLGHGGSVSRLNFRLGPLSFRHCGGMTGALPRGLSRRILRETKLQIHLQRFFTDVLNGRKLLILLVGAGRFERPTPCAQGGFRPRAEKPYFQLLRLQQDGASLLKPVDPCCAWRL